MTTTNEPRDATAGEAPSRESPPPNAQRKGGGWVSWILLLVVVIAAFPSFVVLAIGLSPTLVSYFVERRAHKNATRCMAAMNLAGVAPILVMLWTRGHSLNVALDLLADVYNWLYMFGSAAAAMVLLRAMQIVAASTVEYAARARLRSLLKRQERLIAEWGEEVAGSTRGGT